MKFLAALLLAAVSGTGLANVHLGAPPPDFAVPSVTGSVALSHLRGKPIVINFWASWCPPCTAELPYFQQLRDRYGDRIRIVTIDWNEDPAAAAAYLRAQGLHLPVVWDPQSKIFAAYSLNKVPDTVVVDAAGNVTYVSVGELSPEELAGAVAPLLK